MHHVYVSVCIIASHRNLKTYNRCSLNVSLRQNKQIRILILHQYTFNTTLPTSLVISIHFLANEKNVINLLEFSMIIYSD